MQGSATSTVIACDKREAFVQESAAKQSIVQQRKYGLLRFARNDGERAEQGAIP
jgi:hypothetical protein